MHTHQARVFSKIGLTLWLLLLVGVGCTGLEYDQSDVVIVSPGDGDTVDPEVELDVRATDRIGGDVGFLVVWSSDLDGELGDGDPLSTTLTAGVHEITATADLGRDGVFTDSVTITVR